MISSQPSNKTLYTGIKTYIYSLYPKHSAYRSGLLVKKYKSLFHFLYPNKEPYIGNKPVKHGLTRWFKEDWKSDTGKYKYTSKSSVYRPTIKVSTNTPKTFDEISDKNLIKAKRKKSKHGRVDKF